jgi:hypothetical protein
MLDPYIVLDPEKHDLSSKGHLTKKNFFCCFWYFYIKMNKLQGYSHWKSNFRLKSTHPNIYVNVHILYINGTLQFSAKNMTVLLQNQTTNKFGPFSVLFLINLTKVRPQSFPDPYNISGPFCVLPLGNTSHSYYLPVLCLFRFVSVPFSLFLFNRNTETRCFDIESKQPKQTSCFG